MTFDYVSVSFSTVLLVALFSTRAVVFLLALVEFFGVTVFFYAKAAKTASKMIKHTFI